MHSLTGNVIVGEVVARVLLYLLYDRSSSHRSVSLNRRRVGSLNFQMWTFKMSTPYRAIPSEILSSHRHLTSRFSLFAFQPFTLFHTFLRPFLLHLCLPPPTFPSPRVLPFPILLFSFSLPIRSPLLGKKESGHSRHFCFSRLDRGLNFVGKFLLAVLCGERGEIEERIKLPCRYFGIPPKDSIDLAGLVSYTPLLLQYISFSDISPDI